jgi:NADPH:quinone reductase-like Zn-dependent oxidoreductase
MKAVLCSSYGPPEVLQLGEVARPLPKKNEICIRIFATAVTASDCIIRAGFRLSLLYRIFGRLAIGITAPRQPILGMVVAGAIESVGSDVRAFKPGDKVFGMGGFHFGCYAEFVCWPEDAVLAVLPGNLSYEEAAAIPYGGLLAAHFLTMAGVQADQRVLIYGASGAIGTSAVQLARHIGAEVTGVCSTANLALVRSLGATAVIDYTSENFVDRKERYDVIFDAVGKRKSREAMRQSGRALAPNGRRISVDNGTPRLRRQAMVDLRQLAESGVLRPVIDRRYPLEQMVEAHRYVDQGHKRGNVVVTLS